MRSWNVKVLFCAACIAGATACSGDDASTGGGSLQPFAGAGGSAGSGTASSGGSAGSTAAGSGGGNTGGSAGRAGSAGASSNAGSAGSAGTSSGGSAGSAGAAGAAGAAGTGVDEPGLPDAGAEPPVDEPPVDEPPAEDVVGFSDVYPLLVNNCGSCHSGTPAFLPGFAQPDEAAASALVQPGGLADRIYARTVTERTMPPACRGGNFGAQGCVSQEEADLLQEWADGGYQP